MIVFQFVLWKGKTFNK